MQIIKSFIPVPNLIYKYIKLYKLNRLLKTRILHLIKNKYPKLKKCNICGWHGKMFVDRTNCPVCCSLPRHRLIGYILNEVDLSDKDILLIGPDMPEILLFNKRGINNISILNIEDTFFTNLVYDITNHQLKTNSFDIIIMWHVLEHIEDDILAVNNIYDLLRKNGWVLFSVPIHPLGNKQTHTPTYNNLEEKILQTGHPDHQRCCGEDYGDRFTEVRFKTKKTIMVRNYRTTEIDKYHLDINHFAWCFTK